jgi:hypothetical protein
MLLTVALFAVLFASFGAQRQLYRQRLRAELDVLRHSRRFAEISRPRFTSDDAWRSRLNEVDAEIARVQSELGAPSE